MPRPTDLIVEVHDGVAVLRLNRPERLNAYSPEMGRLLGAAYRSCDDDESVRAIVLTGAGTAFCAGADLKAGNPFAAPAEPQSFTASPVSPAAFELRTPVIAALNGHAIGIGLTLALQADIRVVAEDARCAVPQARLGMVGDCMSHWTLPRLVGMARAADILLTGRTFSGAEAAAMGIANAALPADQVLDHAMEIARDIADSVSASSAASSKRLLWEAAIHGYSPQRVADKETEIHLELMARLSAIPPPTSPGSH